MYALMLHTCTHCTAEKYDYICVYLCVSLCVCVNMSEFSGKECVRVCVRVYVTIPYEEVRYAKNSSTLPSRDLFAHRA